PQLRGSFWSETQTPPQRAVPGGHWHWLFWQTCPVAQESPQPPQFRGSTVGSTQVCWSQVISGSSQTTEPVLQPERAANAARLKAASGRLRRVMAAPEAGRCSYCVDSGV